MNMRQGPNNKRSRGRGRGKHHGGGGGGGGGPRHTGGQSAGQDQVFNIHRTIDSNGPDVKIRGNAHHVYEKYLQLARDANSSGDRVMAENYLQHAEHYYRLIMAFQASVQQQHGQQQQQMGGGQPYGNGGGGQGQGGQYNNNGAHYRQQPNGTGPQPGMDANGNVAQPGENATDNQDEPYREEDSGRYD